MHSKSHQTGQSSGLLILVVFSITAYFAFVYFKITRFDHKQIQTSVEDLAKSSFQMLPMDRNNLPLRVVSLLRTFDATTNVDNIRFEYNFDNTQLNVSVPYERTLSFFVTKRTLPFTIKLTVYNQKIGGVVGSVRDKANQINEQSQKTYDAYENTASKE